MSIGEESLALHRAVRGKLEITPRVPAGNREELSLAYTPGVAQPCLEIEKDPSLSFQLTRRWNLCLVVTDGTAVLGLGDIGPLAAMPVMEGKCVLFKHFGGVDAFPLCVNSKDVDTFVETVSLISGSFGGINLEDISAPRCFEIEEKLKKRCDIPVFHDDQHGTAIVVGAALRNAVRVTGKTMGKLKIVINGAGAAGCAIGRFLLSMGFGDLILCDRQGILRAGDEGLSPTQAALCQVTNLDRRHGTLADAMVGADVFIGVSRPGLVTAEMVASMDHGIVFPMANPVPEIMPEEALRGGAAVVGTGRSDFPNQINNVLAFPGIFRGAFDVRAREINEAMKLAAARALADLVPADQLAADHILPAAFDPAVAPAVAQAVAQAARETGAARL